VKRRLIAFGTLVAVCLGGIAASIGLAGGPSSGEAPARTDATPAASASVLRAATEGSHLLYRWTEPDENFGRLAVASLDHPDRPVWTDLSCERADASADRGICVVADRSALTSYAVVEFDRAGRELDRTALTGLPSRARVSPDGRYGATTTFVSGDSYAADSFSTRTRLYDLHAGEVIGDLEQFTAWLDGDKFDAVDRNFWGVTFSDDSNRFYATMGTGGHTYLVEGDVADRSVTVLRDGVECPSLSPDGTRIAFKKRVDDEFGRVTWRLSVLDLDTLEEHPLAETGNVDDQAEWLDDDTVIYARPRAESGTSALDTWAVPADGTGTPTMFVPGGYSTVVVR
jgi:hypothetical protein